jgi:hypothetical protein
MSVYKDRASISTHCNTKLNETLNKILAHEDKVALLLVNGAELGLKSVDLGLEGCYRILGHGSFVWRCVEYEPEVKTRRALKIE